MRGTDDLLGRDEGEVGGGRVDGELHDSGLQVVHVEGVDHLVELGVLGRSDVDDLPVEGAGQGREALEGDVELEGRQDGRRVVVHHDVVDVHLGHLPPEYYLSSILTPQHLTSRPSGAYLPNKESYIARYHHVGYLLLS